MLTLVRKCHLEEKYILVVPRRLPAFVPVPVARHDEREEQRPVMAEKRCGCGFPFILSHAQPFAEKRARWQRQKTTKTYTLCRNAR